MKNWVKDVHFVGIGGIGMSGIAEVLLNLGFSVSGSDLRESPITERLRSLGGVVHVGHDSANLTHADVVVISSAVKPDNPEVVAARYAGIPVIPRAEMLSEIMRMKRGVAVAGTHGKTTTTSMIAAILTKSGMDPTAIIGGKLNIFGSNAKLGGGEWMVAEADESDGSFLHLAPTVAVITNVDREHMEHYGTLDNLHDAFVEFTNRVPFYGLVVACVDDKVTRSLIPRIKRRVVTYGTSGDADVRAADLRCAGGGCEFLVVRQGEGIGKIRLGVPGEHNAVNAAAALAVAYELGVAPAKAAAGLHEFSGVGRRFEIKGETAGVTVIDDYGHHPTEVRATLKAARDYLRSTREPNGARLVVVFQPHRYSRTRDLWDEFVESFNEADLLVTTRVYPAGEDPIKGITGEGLNRAIAARRSERGLKTMFVPEVSDVAVLLSEEVEAKDVVVTLGAGNVFKAGEDLLKVLEESS